MIEIRIPKEIKNYREKFFFGLTVRQCICAAIALLLCVPLYIFGGKILPQEVVSWLVLTWIYMDEVYLLFANEYSANFLFELYKRARKWGGVPTGITQNVEDLLKSETARSMLSNTDFVMMLNQATSDRVQLARLLNISDNLLAYVTNSDSGQGLICCGGSVIPFRDKFPHNELYDLMTTRLEDLHSE